MKEAALTSLPWEDYELLDSGENMKLERFGEIVLARPETQALWKKQRPELWAGAHAEFISPAGVQKGEWRIRKVKPSESALRFNLAEGWELSRGQVRFLARLTGFKHAGVFPEQAPNWEWLAAHVKGFVNPSSDEGFTKPQILNLFGYTGIASIVAAQAGAFVTHVDASRQSLDWAHENARRSGLDEKAIRWLPDDALAFAKRELRRGTKYEGVILDPPAFGRGTKGEVWRIAEDLPDLLAILKGLLSDAPGTFFLMSGYAAGYSARSFAQAVESVFAASDAAGAESGLRLAKAGFGHAEAGELFIKESVSERVIPAGIYVRFARR